jgi:hypothetical protein
MRNFIYDAFGHESKSRVGSRNITSIKGLKMHYQISGFHKITELDNFEQGCVGESNEQYFAHSITAKTLEELIKKAENFTNGERGEFWEDDPSRVDFQTTETGDGYPATPLDVNRWKRGELKLYAVTYTCYVEQVSTANLAGILS